MSKRTLYTCKVCEKISSTTNKAVLKNKVCYKCRNDYAENLKVDKK